MKKQFISGIAAAALCTSLFTATASAEASDSEKLRLLTVPFSDFCPEGTDLIDYMGGNTYGNYDIDKSTYYNNFLIITEEDKKHWRETGEFIYKKVDTGVDDEELMLYSGLLFGSEYLNVYTDDKMYILQTTDDPTVWKIVNEFETFDKFGAVKNDCDINGSYCEVEETDNGNLFRFVNTDGISAEFFFECDEMYRLPSVNDSAYTIVTKKNTEETEDGIISCIEEYYVNSQGDVQKVFELDGVTDCFYVSYDEYFNLIYFRGEKNINRVYDYKETSSIGAALTIDNNINIDSVFPEYEGRKLCLIGFIDGDRAVGYFCNKFDYDDEEFKFFSVLLDISDMNDVKFVSDKTYTEIFKSSYNDDVICERFLASDGEKWGFIDRNGQELARFDDAGDFGTEYAPVIQDGKLFLINKDMEPVSEEIDADGCYQVADDLFQLEKDNKKYLVTFAEPLEKVEEAERIPNITETDVPKTGYDNIRLVAVLLTAGAAAAAVSKKHK